MSQHLTRDLDTLTQHVLSQSAVVEEMIRLACRGLFDRSGGATRRLAELEPRVNETEVRVEEECLNILARHQPVAIDLRRVATVLKLNTDLERIADLAVNIGERSLALAEFPAFKTPASLERMSELAIAMVRDALDSFVQLDAEAAREVCLRDDQVDDANREAIGHLCAVMAANPSLIEAALHFFSAARHVERIADHATNIAEDVVYLVEGEIARHRHDDAPGGGAASGTRTDG